MKSSGQTIIELLIVMALLAILLPVLIGGLISSREGRSQQKQRIQANQILLEVKTAVDSVREKGWSNIGTDGTYHPATDGFTWSLVSGTEVSNGFSKSITITSVSRDANNAIVLTGGTIDPATKKVAIQISWGSPLPSSISSSYYLTRFLDNNAFEQSTQADFDTGTLSNVFSTNVTGGEVTLATNVKGKWCEPQLASVTIDLPGTPRAITAREGHVYAATSQVAGGGVDSFAHVLVANTDPPTFTLHGKFQDYQANAVFGEENWGYIATTNDSKEIVIINFNVYSNIPNKIYQEAGYFNTASSSLNGDTIFVYNNRGYMTAGNRLYVFDLSSKTGSRARIGNYITFANWGDKANEIYVREVSGQVYVYIAIEGSTVDEMKIANVTNHNVSSQWRIVGVINIEPNNCSSLESGKAIYVNPAGSRAYVSSVNDTTFKEFFIIDTTNKASPSLVGGFATNPPCTNGGGYEAGGLNPEQSVVVSTLENRALLVGTDAIGDLVDAPEYQVLNIESEASPSLCGSLQFNQGIYGVAAVKETDGDAYTYLITGDSGNELKVIQGGPDGNYVESGVYESASFDAGYSTIFNNILPTYSEPADTTVEIQVAIADAVSGSCNGANYQYVGPDGTSNTFFTEFSVLPQNDDASGYENPGRCMRYRVYFETTNYSSTPVLDSISINYSP